MTTRSWVQREHGGRWQYWSWTHVLLAHVVPRKGLAHKHDSQELLRDLQKLGYHEVILKCDGEPALRSVQEEVKRRREAPAVGQLWGWR